MKNFKDFAELFLVLIGLHYFYSYVILVIILKGIGINFLPVISMEDITFSYGETTYQILLMSSLGILLIYFLHLFLLDNFDSKEFFKTLSENYNSLIKNIHRKYFLSKSFTLVKSISTLSISIIWVLIIYFLIGTKLIHDPNWKFGLVLLFEIIFVPFLYMTFEKKRDLIVKGYIFSIIFIGVLLIKNSFDNYPKKGKENERQIVFQYQGTTINDSNYNCLFTGYKYLIVQNKLTGEKISYPMREVGFIIYKDAK